MAGYNGEDAAVAYHYPNQRDVAGAMWLQTSGAVQSPYVKMTRDGTLQIAAIYPGYDEQQKTGNAAK